MNISFQTLSYNPVGMEHNIRVLFQIFSQAPCRKRFQFRHSVSITQVQQPFERV